MEVFIYYIFCVFGATHILVSSKIMTRLRNWMLINLPFIGEILECYQCTSFWVSMGLYFFFNDLNINTASLNFLGVGLNLKFLFFSFMGSGIVSFLSLLMSVLIKKTK